MYRLLRLQWWGSEVRESALFCDEMWCWCCSGASPMWSVLERQCCPGEAGGRMEIMEKNKWNLNIHMMPGQASSRSYLHKWSIEGKCLWNIFPFFRSFLWCRWRIALFLEPDFTVHLLPVLSLPRPPRKDHSLTLPCSELGLELFLCQRNVFYLVFHVFVRAGRSKKQNIEVESLYLAGQVSPNAHGPLKTLLPCWIDLWWEQACRSLAQ